jgi:hypothetical protein
VDDGDPGYVKFKPPRKAAFGLMGIHSTDRLTAKSLDEAADKFLAGWKKNFRKRVVTLSRRRRTLPSGMAVVEVMHRMGPRGGGTSRKVIALAGKYVFVVDSETYTRSWNALEHTFERIAASFQVRR